MEIIKIPETGSTNTWLSQNEEKVGSTAMVYCVNQTAGRGQKGNSWESEPGKNITASIIFHPDNFPAPLQFKISEAVAIALTRYLREKGVDAKVKWPNDIYIGDKKICGILVEHVVTGKNISRTIAGFGININQEKFLSDAPNPVSLFQLTGLCYDIDEEVKKVATNLEKYLTLIGNEENLHSEFLNLLWRNDGKLHNFYDKLKEERIKARIGNVGEDGILTLITERGEERNYAFKEVEVVLNEWQTGATFRRDL